MTLNLSKPCFPGRPVCKHCRSALRQLAIDFSTGMFRKQSPAFSLHCPQCDGPDLASPHFPPT